MKRSLYEIEQDIETLLTESINPDTGELILDADTLESLETERYRKIEGVIKYYRNTLGDVEKFKAEIKSLNARKKSLENTANSIKRCHDNAQPDKKRQDNGA